MNQIVTRTSQGARLTLGSAAVQQDKRSLMQDPAMILIGALGLSFIMLLGVTGWLLIAG
jgi:hypothetical protein